MPLYSESTLAAVKNAVDIVALVGEYLPLVRSGSKFKALCPFHDDHNPSLELNPERQSFKCWVCGAGGDVFDFVKGIDRVELPEALRMLAERAGVVLESPSSPGRPPSPTGPSKADLLAVSTPGARDRLHRGVCRRPRRSSRMYVEERGITRESRRAVPAGLRPGRPRLADDSRLAARVHVGPAGTGSRLVRSRSSESPAFTHERFRGRLIFPIHDLRGRALGFGGRILPAVEKSLAASGKKGAKYVNSSETMLFQKRRLLYAADLARSAAREAGWVAVVEGYTDVIAAHQTGLGNVVAALGTALGDDHVTALRRLADRVVLVLDGDEAGQNAADRSLELFLGHEVDVRVLTLPDNLDPCDFLLREGADAFRALVGRAVDPVEFALRRAEVRFDLDSIEGARQASEWVLAIFARIPSAHRGEPNVKADKALDRLSQRLRVPSKTLRDRLKQLHPRTKHAAPHAASEPAPGPIRPADLDPIESELVQIVLHEPSRRRPIGRAGAGRLDPRHLVASNPSSCIRPLRRGGIASVRAGCVTTQ